HEVGEVVAAVGPATTGGVEQVPRRGVTRDPDRHRCGLSRVLGGEERSRSGYRRDGEDGDGPQPSPKPPRAAANVTCLSRNVPSCRLLSIQVTANGTVDTRH